MLRFRFDPKVALSEGFITLKRLIQVDVLATSFHQQKTTHLLLVEAFLGRDLLEESYIHALDNGYRFLSYGDGMVLS